MGRNALLLLGVFAELLSCASPTRESLAEGAAVDGSEAFHFEKDAMGTRFRIVLFTDEGREYARAAADAAFSRIDILEERASDWRSDSEISRLSREASRSSPRSQPGGYVLSTELADLFVLCEEMRERSGGRFDPAVGLSTKRWRRALRQGAWPSDSAQDRGRETEPTPWHMEEGRIMIDGSLQRGQDRAAVGFDLGAVAKGAALDAALAELETRGITSAMVEGGGDLLCGDPPPGMSGWRIEMAPGESFSVEERRGLSVSQAAVATSGSHSRGGRIGDRFRSHLVRADTAEALGESGERIAACVIVQRDGRTDAGARADALATVLCLLGERDREGLLHESTDFKARTWTQMEGESTFTQGSREFDSWEASRSVARTPRLRPAPLTPASSSPQ